MLGSLFRLDRSTAIRHAVVLENGISAIFNTIISPLFHRLDSKKKNFGVSVNEPLYSLKSLQLVQFGSISILYKMSERLQVEIVKN